MTEHKEAHNRSPLIPPIKVFCTVHVCSHHYKSEVVGVRAAAVCALDLQFVASHSTDLHLMDEPGDQQ